MFNRLRTILLGSPLPTEGIYHTRLGVFRALASFSPDALSSIAYANQEIFLGLAAAGVYGLAFTFPIGVVISSILFIVAMSYYQTIQVYPSGGGSYVVVRDNLGRFPGLITGAALLLDYLLTAAVSLSTGVDALASAFPGVAEHRVMIALLFLALITLINLRGVKETGTVLAVPVYLFVGAYAIMILVGLVKIIAGAPLVVQNPPPIASQPVTLFLLLRAFASGSTALTGIEAISDSVPAFKEPTSRRAGQALIIMALLMAFLFLGTLGLIQYFKVSPLEGETILSALARGLFGTSVMYYLVQITTLAVLAVAANTAFSGFPRVAVFLAQDKFLPHQLKALGDRLVFTNGILFLAAGTAAVLVLFGGDSHALVPLFAIGAFLAFSFSQAGMVLHWLKEKGTQWKIKAVMNGIGTIVTVIMLVVVGAGKFVQGAWMTFIAIPLLVLVFLRIERHYLEIADQLSFHDKEVAVRPYNKLRLVIPISGIHMGIIDAVQYALTISNDITAVYVEIEPGQGEKIEQKWGQIFPNLPLKVVPSPYRSIIQPLLDFLDRYDEESDDGMLAGVVIPEFITPGFLENILHNQMAWLIKFTLLYRRRKLGYQRMIIDVPYHLDRNRMKRRKYLEEQGSGAVNEIGSQSDESTHTPPVE